MIATKRTILDLESSLQRCRDTSADLSTKMRDQESIINEAQAEIRTINESMQKRVDSLQHLNVRLKDATEQLGRATDYAKAARGSIRNMALDDERSKKKALEEIRAQLASMQESQKPEDKKDQVLLEALNLKISNAQSALAQFDAQQTTNSLTRDRLHTELGQARYEVLSAKLKQSKHEQEERAKSLQNIEERYAKERADSFSQLDEWGHLKRKLQEENDVTDVSDIRALEMFAAACQYIADHPIMDMDTVRILEIDSYNLASYEHGGSNSNLFAERARQARAKIAELNHQ